MTFVSLVFYAYGEPVYVLLMILSAFLNYLCARMIADQGEKKKLFLTAGLVVNLGLLGVFKYAGFAVHTCNSLFGLHVPVPSV